MTIRQAIHRLVLPNIASPAARAVVRRVADERGIPVVDCPVVGGTVVARPDSGDVMVHSIPDVFGRAFEPPSGWRVVRIVDGALGMNVEAETIRFGRPSVRRPGEVSRRLREVWKPIGQQRGVRPLHRAPGAFGLAFIAPSGVEVPDDLTATPVLWPGLPDLVVVHHPEVSAWDAYDGPIESPEWT